MIGRRSAEQRLLEAQAGHGKPGDTFIFDNPCPYLDETVRDDDQDPDATTAYRTRLSD